MTDLATADLPDWALTPEQRLARQRAEPVRPLIRLWKPLRILFWLYIATGAVVALLQALSLLAALRFESSNDLPPQVVSAYAIVLLLLIFAFIASAAIYVVTVVLFLKFVYRAAKTLQVVGAKSDVTPAFAAFSYFIPVGGWFLPFIALRKVWRATFDPDQAQAPVPPLFNAWWALWLASTVLALRLKFFSGDQEVVLSIASLTGSDAGAKAVQLASTICSIGAALCVAPIFRQLAEAQQRFLPKPAQVERPPGGPGVDVPDAGS